MIERCERAANNGNGIEEQDVDVLKLLYLVRYVDDVRANLDNIVILMANDLRLDKIIMREQVQSSLNRLLKENYIGHTQDIYNFLTDEEQDVQREIKNTPVAAADIVGHISNIIFGEIYITKKFRYNDKYDFAFDRMVDGQAVGTPTNDMMMRILTVATNPVDKSDLRLMTESVGKIIVLLTDDSYYDYLEQAMKIQKYVKQRNVAQLPKSVQDIIRAQQDAAKQLEFKATDALKKAIINAKFYVDGGQIEIKIGDAKTKLDKALARLVTRVYSDIELITNLAESDADIIKILRGTTPTLQGTEPNKEAVAKVETFLDMQFKLNLPTTIADLQERFRKKPYGWREVDIAALIATLIFDQKVTIKYAGTTIQPDDKNLPDMLRKKNETGKTSICKRQAVAAQKIREVREFLLDFFDDMIVPQDEDGLVKHIDKKFNDELEHYKELDARYAERKYPDQDKVKRAIALAKDILSQKKITLP